MRRESEDLITSHPLGKAVPIRDTELEETVRTLERVAHVMDSAFLVPGTNIRIGLDGLIGLIPGVGDLLSTAPLGYYMYLARKYGLGKRVYLRLVWNQLVDFAIGSIPLVGDLFDFGFKAHKRNANLLIEQLRKR